ncbi:hypothetical protein [Legionella tunisiensis]|uniref:hypothetical protein n=1 Tax=Legionella tunisiensis TaxID=1034944 RepID=UPI000382855D|nr:hypothetical protein [Legionella tunisiensis]
MLIVTQIISQLTILMRHQAEIARLTQRQTTALYTFSRQLTSTRGVDKLLELGTQHIANAFNSSVMILLPKKQNLSIHACYPAQQKLDTKERSIAEWVYEMGQPAGFGTETLSFSKALYCHIGLIWSMVFRSA